MINVIDLTDKRILITGASSGMGKETAILCSKLGAKLILVSRNEDKLKETLACLEGDGHCYFPFDLSRVDEIDAFIKELITQCGPLDGFVHSAGVGSSRPIKLLKPSALREVMELNFYSFVEIIRCVTKRNCYREGMSIVGISSISSKQGNQAKTAYSASKAAMDAATRCLAKELWKQNVRVNTVNPALIQTDMFQSFLDNGGDSEDAKNVLLRQYAGLGEPIDVANMIAYLLSDASKFITGTNVMLDGGRMSS
ncbi:MAG: SDR family oxidoreductase [Clostridia bacterium]|nr:SDR family oxidoreductase [Clostridia bacterium]